MSFFFSKGAKVKPQFTGLQTQTSTSAVPVTLLYGRNRIAPNIIWQGDFATHKKKVKAGKGMGGSQTTYTYSASFQLALCWGPIVSVIKVWKDQSKETSYAALGFSLFTGTTPQSPWGYLTTAHPTEALGYPGIAHLDVANYDLGQSNTLTQHNFEVKGLLEGTGFNAIDADPAQVIGDFLSNVQHGAGFTSTIIDSDSLYSTAAAPTTGDGAFQTYCRAIGFALSPAFTSQQKASEILERITMICNAALVWTGYSLKFHPYGPDTITANGVTYIPDFPIRYYLSDADFICGNDEDPVRLNRVDPADASNSMSLVIANRSNEYNDLPVAWADQSLIDQYGRREESSMDAKEVCDPVMAALMVALLGQRKAYQRNSFQVKLSPRFCRLEPMDVLQLTDPRFGVFTVLITELNEDSEGLISITAEEYNASVSQTVQAASQAIVNTPLNTNVTPSAANVPIIFEPPSSLAGSTPQIWAAVSGGDGTTYDPNWGGAYVWLSTDNITYNQIGEIATPARMGKLTAALAAYAGANPGPNTLSVTLLQSNGDLSDAASAADAAANATLSYIQGEYLSYQTTALTGPNAYNLTSLYRHQYGSTGAAHAIGDKFVRLDDAIFKYDLPSQYIGVPLYIKFQSFNSFHGAVQDLSTTTAYTITPTGAGSGTAAGGKPAIPTGLSASATSAGIKLTWTANVANDNVTAYKIYRAAGSGLFAAATLIDTVAAASTSYTDISAASSTAYTYYLVAVNAIGDSVNSTGVAITSSATTALTIWSVTATGTGASQGITLPYTIANGNRRGILVKVNGLVWPTADYSLAGTTLTLTSNASGDAIEIVGLITS